MKGIFIALFIVGGVFVRSSAQQNELKREGPACPIEDPLARDDPVPINVTASPILELFEGSEITNLVAVGLPTFHYKVWINTLDNTFLFEVTIAEAHGNGTFDATGYIDARPFRQETFPSGNITSTGPGFGKVSVTSFNVTGRVTFFVSIVTNKVHFYRLALDTLSFSAVSVDLGSKILIGGLPVDWAEVSANIKSNFDSDLAENKIEIADKIRQVANNLFGGKYTLSELIELIIGNGDDDPEC